MDGDIEQQLAAQVFIEEFKKNHSKFFEDRRAYSSEEVEESRQTFSDKSLKSDLKKSTAFVKRIRAITTEGVTQCIRELDSLNLNRHIEEIVMGLVETKFKATEVPVVLQLASALHTRYEDFTQPFISGLKDSLLSRNESNNDQQDDKDVSKRKRIQLRLMIELYQLGIHEESRFFFRYLNVLLGRDNEGKKVKPIDLPSLTTFIKYGSETLLGCCSLQLVQMAKHAEVSLDSIPLKRVCPIELSQGMKELTLTTYNDLCNTMIKAHKDMKKKEKNAEKDTALYGNITDVKAQALEGAQKFHEKLLSAITTLSDHLGMEVPEVEEEEEEEEEVGKGGISVFTSSNSTDTGPYLDIETKSFYEDLPDLLAMVPLTALGLTTEEAAAMRESWKTSKDLDAVGEGPGRSHND